MFSLLFVRFYFVVVVVKDLSCGLSRLHVLFGDTWPFGCMTYLTIQRPCNRQRFCSQHKVLLM